MEKMKNIKKFITIILIIVFTVIWYVGITVINSIDDKAEIELDSIVIIDNTDELNTFNGECLIQGKISSDNTVSYEVLSEECICVSKETQEYKSHYRNRTYTDSNGRTRTRRVLEYDWEKIDFEKKSVSQLNLEGFTFESSKVNIKETHLLTQKDVNNDKLRFVYKGIKSGTEGTLKASFDNGKIVSGTFYLETKEELLEELKKNLFRIRLLAVIIYIIWTIFLFGIYLIFEEILFSLKEKKQ